MKGPPDVYIVAGPPRASEVAHLRPKVGLHPKVGLRPMDRPR